MGMGGAGKHVLWCHYQHDSSCDRCCAACASPESVTSRYTVSRSAAYTTSLSPCETTREYVTSAREEGRRKVVVIAEDGVEAMETGMSSEPNGKHRLSAMVV